MIEPSPAPRNLTARDWRIFGCSFIALMLFCIILPRALTFLPTALGLVFFTAHYVVTKRWPRIDLGLVAFLGAIVIYMSIALAWSLEPDYAFHRVLKTVPILLATMAVLFIAGMAQPFPAKDRLAIVFSLCCGLAGFVLAFEYQFGFPLSRFILRADVELPASIRNGFLLNRSTVYLVLLSMPALLFLGCSAAPRKTKLIVGGFHLLGLLSVLLVTQSQTAQIVTFIALIALALPFHKTWLRRLLTIGLLTLFLLAPLLPGPVYNYVFGHEINFDGIVYRASVPHRLEVWNFMANEIKAHPLLGQGIEAARFLYSPSHMRFMDTDHVMHPHNAVLQIWLEHGLIGIALAGAFVVFLLRKLDPMPPLLQRYYSVLFVTMIAILSMGYGLWQPWQLGMIMTIPALSVMAARVQSIGRTS